MVDQAVPTVATIVIIITIIITIIIIITIVITIVIIISHHQLSLNRIDH
jgi:hypothetical protein